MKAHQTTKIVAAQRTAFTETVDKRSRRGDQRALSEDVFDFVSRGRRMGRPAELRPHTTLGKTLSSGGDLKIIGAASLVSRKEPFGVRIVPSGMRKGGRLARDAGAGKIAPEP